VVVVENYGHVARIVGELVQKGARQRPDRRRRSWSENPLPNPLLDGLEGYHQVGEKTRGVAVALVERGQATGWSLPLRPFNHSPSKVLLPKPAGAEMRVSLRSASGSSLVVNRGRATSFRRAWEGRSLVDTSLSDAPIILRAHLQHLILLAVGIWSCAETSLWSGAYDCPRRTLYLDQDLIERVERLAMEVHPNTALGQHSVEARLRSFCTSKP
jgi:hypothetical protein